MISHPSKSLPFLSLNFFQSKHTLKLLRTDNLKYKNQLHLSDKHTEIYTLKKKIKIKRISHTSSLDTYILFYKGEVTGAWGEVSASESNSLTINQVKDIDFDA